MSAKAAQKARKPEYPYAAVERALAEVFHIGAAGQRGWLRGRLQHFRRLGLTPEGPGKGRTIAYAVQDIDRWLIGLELAHFRLDPKLIVELISSNWDRRHGDHRRAGDQSAGEAFDRGEATLHGLVTIARERTHPDDDVMMIVWFDEMSGKPVIGYMAARGMDSFAGWLTVRGIDGYGRWRGEDRDIPRRAAIFNLSDRIRRLDRSLAAPPAPPLPGGVAGKILKAGRRARGEER